MGDTIVIETPVATVLEVTGLQGPQGPTGAAGASQADVLTTQGDLLYRGASEAARLPIGTSGQVLKVSGGVPAWANESGGVPTSRTISAGTGLTGGGDLSANRTLAVSFGSSAGTACAGNDSRLSDSRTPTAHAATHGFGGSDEISIAAAQIADPGSINAGTAGGFFDQATAALGASMSDGNITITTNGNSGSFNVVVNTESVTANRTLTVPNATGTIALTSDIPSSVTSVSGTAPIVSSGGTTPAISIQNSPTFTGDVTINGASTGVSGSLKVGSTTGSFNRDVEIGGNGIVLRNIGGSGTTTIALGQGSTSSYTLTPPAASGTIALTGHTHAASDITSGTINTARLASGTANSGTFLRGDQTWAAVSGVTTGSVDNAVLRADGVSGSQSQGSAFIIADNATASPNNTVNHASIQATGDTTNVSVSIVPKGSGAFMLRVPDAASTGGNARGANAVDLQTSRSAATQVASGDFAVVVSGRNNTASGSDSSCLGGYSNAASAFMAAVVGGRQSTASNDSSGVFASDSSTSSGTRSVVLGGGNNTASATDSFAAGARAVANRVGMQAFASGLFAANGDAQRIRAVLRCATTTNAAVEMALDGGTTYLTIPSGKVMYGEIYVVGVRAGGADVAIYRVVYAAKNIGGLSTEVFSSVTTDAATGTSLEVATVDAGDYIRVRPTGVLGQNWRWVAKVDMVEVGHG